LLMLVEPEKPSRDTKKELEKYNKKMESYSSYKNKLEKYIENIEKEKYLKHWKEVNNDDLRTILYTKGFTIRKVDKNTGEISETDYVVYKRSSAKSRVGQCLFIKKDLRDVMINWSRMEMNFAGHSVDYPSMLAYESLVGSSLQSLIKIDTKNI
ncbi:hypothetical protein M3691_37470, partial [Paenibacillus elgii]|nr:hypothetical protein [Paenibacillus elgii]